MTNNIEAFPLCWPPGRERTRWPEHSRFQVTPGEARGRLLEEIRMLGGTDVILSTNMELRLDGLPYANRKIRNDDHGVAVYFTYKKKQHCFACDKWNRIQDNMRAIQKTIEALRGIARWGTGDMMERAFTGFEALPAPTQWFDVLGVQSAGCSRDDIDAAYRKKAMTCHPDRGGSEAQMAELNWARDAGLAAVAA